MYTDILWDCYESAIPFLYAHMEFIKVQDPSSRVYTGTFFVSLKGIFFTWGLTVHCIVLRTVQRASQREFTDIMEVFWSPYLQ